MRNEYPRPQFQRENWLNLNGVWQFEFDYDDMGSEQHWEQGDIDFSSTIEVPFAYQAKASGLSDQIPSDIVWYKRLFMLDSITDKTIINFGASDYITEVYVNENYVGQHIGGHTSFSMDISSYVNEGQNTLAVKVKDFTHNEWIPRGKQFWKGKSEAIWYTNTTGIWQTVWIEQLNEIYLESVRITPDLDKQSVEIIPTFNQLHPKLSLRTIITYENELIVDSRQVVTTNQIASSYEVLSQKIMNGNAHGPGRLWSPEHPNLFSIKFEVYLWDDLVDTVDSYFGMRKIHIENGKFYLNNRPYYQKLVLDQGYWPDTLLTAETDDDFIKDIEIAKEMGFNGCRKHQKVEDPRFFYHADTLGFLVWGESASPANFNLKTIPLVIKEWDEIIHRDYNHPSIVAWTPANESWGVSEINYNAHQQHFMQSLYHYVKSLDLNRLVIVNDGWEMIDTDIIGVHNYKHGSHDQKAVYEQFKNDLSTTDNLLNAQHANRNIIVKGHTYKDQPIMLTEFGGISYVPETDVAGAWGYTSASDENELIADYDRIIVAIQQSEALTGFCYTQLTDVEQETNGLVDYHRHPKFEFEKIKAINDRVNYR